MQANLQRQLYFCITAHPKHKREHRFSGTNEIRVSFGQIRCLDCTPGCIKFRVCISNLAKFERLAGGHQEDEIWSASIRSNSIHSNGTGAGRGIGNGITFSTLLYFL